MNKLTTAITMVAMALGIEQTPAQETINHNSADTSKNLMEVMNQEKPENQMNAMTFEDAKTLQENQELFKRILNDEKIQKLIDEYGEDEVKQVIIEKDTQKVIEKALEDNDIQEAIKEGDREKAEKRIQKIVKEFCKTQNWTDIVCTIIGFLIGDAVGDVIYQRYKNRQQTKKSSA